MIQNVNKSLEKMDKMLEKLIKKAPVVEKNFKPLAAKGIRPSFIALAIGSLILFIAYFVFGFAPLSNLLGFAYPLYASFKALRTEETDDDTQWLTYWVVYGFFTVIESFADIFLVRWIPMYHLMKLFFLLWCMLPSTCGATIIYEKILVPHVFEKYESQIDASASHLMKLGEDTAKMARQKTQNLADQASEVLKKAE